MFPGERGCSSRGTDLSHIMSERGSVDYPTQRGSEEQRSRDADFSLNYENPAGTRGRGSLFVIPLLYDNCLL